MKKKHRSNIIHACSGMNRRSFLKNSGIMGLGFALGGMLPFSACHESNSPVPHESNNSSPNIILIVVDTLRADHLSAYGYSSQTTPNIDGLVYNANLFENAIGPAPWTLPAYTSLLSGKFAFNHNQNEELNLPVNTDFLIEQIKSCGYATKSIQTNLYPAEIDYDFDERSFYNDETTKGADKAAIDEALSWVNANKSSKFFLFIGMMSPHWPYISQTNYLSEFVINDFYLSKESVIVEFPDSCETVDTTNSCVGLIRYESLPDDLKGFLGEPTDGEYYKDSRLYVAAYDNEIKYADAQIGRLLDYLQNNSLLDNSMIIIVADHGERMVDHAPYFSHGGTLYNACTHVPLVIKLPGQNYSQTISDYVRTIDVLPTIYDMISLSMADDVDGKSLLPIIYGHPVNYDDRPIISYSEDLRSTAKDNRIISVISNNYKLIKQASSWELYNLIDDPNEQKNIISQKTDVVEFLNSYLDLFYSF